MAGWVILSPIISYHLDDGRHQGVRRHAAAHARNAEPGFFPLTHLWFLYQLLLIYVAVIAVRSLVARLDPAQKLRGLVDKAVTRIDSHDGAAHSRSASRSPRR